MDSKNQMATTGRYQLINETSENWFENKKLGKTR